MIKCEAPCNRFFIDTEPDPVSLVQVHEPLDPVTARGYPSMTASMSVSSWMTGHLNADEKGDRPTNRHLGKVRTENRHLPVLDLLKVFHPEDLKSFFYVGAPSPMHPRFLSVPLHKRPRSRQGYRRTCLLMSCAADLIGDSFEVRYDSSLLRFGNDSEQWGRYRWSIETNRYLSGRMISVLTGAAIPYYRGNR